MPCSKAWRTTRIASASSTEPPYVVHDPSASSETLRPVRPRRRTFIAFLGFGVELRSRRRTRRKRHDTAARPSVSGRSEEGIGPAERIDPGRNLLVQPVERTLEPLMKLGDEDRQGRGLVGRARGPHIDRLGHAHAYDARRHRDRYDTVERLGDPPAQHGEPDLLHALGDLLLGERRPAVVLAREVIEALDLGERPAVPPGSLAVPGRRRVDRPAQRVKPSWPLPVAAPVTRLEPGEQPLGVRRLTLEERAGVRLAHAVS